MAAAKKLTPQQQRDRRAKIMLGVLGAVLLLVLAIEVPGMLGGKKASPPPATVAAPAATPAAATSFAGVAVVATAQTGQLHSFSHFAAKDPFHALVRTAGGSGSTSTTPASQASSAAAKAAGAGTTTRATPPPAPTVTFAQSTTTTKAAPTGPMVLGAVMKLNGTRRLVAVGSTFPAANPVFKLVAVGRKAIWISLIGGSFGAGQQTLKIQLGRPIKLVNTTASTSYLLNLVRMTMLPKPATPPPAATPAPSAATTTSAAPPATTTSVSGG
ncbi:MAG TPA: hypothetical protein VGU02_05795 [Gaiellaceae bacterium]|nr:hypothetical protein [Gaiellaceae bacterium]